MSMPLRLCAVVLMMLALAACETSEERAERHYQQAVASLQAGEADLALVDLRRVFEYDGAHRPARSLYAATVRDLGRLQEAYGQYLLLAEQFPTDLEARVALAEMAFASASWEEMERHGNDALALNPDAPELAPIKAAIDYRAAVLDEDNTGIAAAVNGARAVLIEDPADPIARRILISYLLSSDNPEAALPEIDRALEQAPEDLELHLAKLRLVSDTQDGPAIDAQLKRMFVLFPENTDVQQALLRWHISRDDTDAAEAFLRELAALRPDEPAGHLMVVSYLQQTKGTDAAMGELDALIADAEGTEAADLYRSMAAGLTFEQGNPAAAIAELRTILETATPSDQTRDIKIVLTRILLSTGDRVGAQALVAEILAEDASNVPALKLKAAWAIEEDRAGDAIIDLRRALDQAPRDPEIFTLMAQAHEREGSLELAGERLSLAVEASEAAVPESQRYARFLLFQGRVEPARRVLETALAGAPQDLDVIGLLAEIAVQEEDWVRAAALQARLEDRTDRDAQTIYETLTTALLLSQNRVEDAVSRLEALVDTSEAQASRRALVTLTLVRARAGDIEGARTVLAEAIADAPEDMQLRMLEVVLDLGTDDLAAAEEKLRAILVEVPGAQGPVNQLYTLLVRQGRQDEAEALIAEQLTRAPESRYLRLMQGGILGTSGQVDAAIEIFEGLYAEDTSDVVIANNLASLLSTYRSEDAATLERAAAIARRLRGREVPAFQDTYGWIALLRGDLGEALAHLEPAAAGLPSDALVQYHLGRAYEAVERSDEARVQYLRALALARDSEIADLPQFADASNRIAALEAASSAVTD